MLLNITGNFSLKLRNSDVCFVILGRQQVCRVERC